MKNNCKICDSIADKTGSHIVPHFLMKRIDTEEGKKGRDKEMGFVISEKNPSSYFGRATSLEKLEEVYNKIDEERIENNNIPLIEDYIFCSKCETKLAELEDSYSKSLTVKTDEKNENFNSKIDSEKALIFWSSIFYRLSISKNSGFKLREADEKMLKDILKEYFEYGTIHPDANNISYKLLRAVNYSNTNSTLLHINPQNQNPYLAVIDEYLIIFSLGKDILVDKFYNTLIPTNEAETNSLTKDTEIIYSIENNVLTNLNAEFFNKAAEYYRKNLFAICDLIYQKFRIGDKMPDKMKDEIFDEIAKDEEISFGDKYSIKHQSQIIYKVIKKNVG